MTAEPRVAAIAGQWVVTELDVRAVDVPLDKPLMTSSGALTSVPLVLLDMHTQQGVTGHAYVFTYTRLALTPMARLIRNLAPLIQGQPVSPHGIEAKLQSVFRLLGPQGLTGMAMAAVDMAAWDALARGMNQPLATLLGGQPGAVPAYASYFMRGLEGGLEDAGAAAERGFSALKIKVGYDDVETDIEVIRAIRKLVGDGVRILVDYNQSLSVPEAIRRCGLLDAEGLGWIEEPVLAHDFAGHARVAAQTRTPIQFGENWWGLPDMGKSIAAGASDLVMPDVMKIGGVSGWLRAAALAEYHGLPMSSHLFQEVSAHLLAVTPTAHLLENMPLADPILRHPLQFEHGRAVISERPGSGIEWDEAAVKRYVVSA